MKPSFSLPKAEDADVYLDRAMRQGSAAAKRIKGGLDRTMKARNMELERFSTVQASLIDALERIHNGYPSFDQMSEFLRQLFSLDLDVGRVRQALGGVNHATTMVRALTREHREGVKHATSVDGVVKTRSAYLGRIASVMRQVGKHLQVLNEARDVLRNLPTIDDELYTLALAGFPNVGKSTLLSKITSARPEIKPYAFTTKGLNVGYFEYKYNKIQCVDTPGTLDRTHTNDIERKAEVAIKYLAKLVVYVVDPTEGGYSLAQQRKLFERTVELGTPVIVYISKTDIADEKNKAAALSQYKNAFTDPLLLRKEIIARFKQDF